jgi:hypothetical protein
MQVTMGVKNGYRVNLVKEQIIDVTEHVKHNPKLASILGGVLPLTLVLGTHSAFASPQAVPVIGGAVKDKIIHSFDPLIDLIQALAFPIAGVMIAGGCLFIMVGNRERGMQMLQNAAMGYILVQLSPLMLELLVGIGSAV